MRPRTNHADLTNLARDQKDAACLDPTVTTTPRARLHILLQTCLNVRRLLRSSMVAVLLQDEKKSRKTEKSSTKTKEIKRGSLLWEAPASSPSNVSPAPHPLYLLHYAIKSVITILDAGLQMSQITITPGRNTLTYSFNSHPLYRLIRDARVKTKMGKGARIKNSSRSYWFPLSLLLLISYPFSRLFILRGSYTMLFAAAYK